MRLILAPLALCLATPALARDHVPQRPVQVEEMARALGSPAAQAGLADVVNDLLDAVLDTRIGPLARYTDPRDDLRARDTLRDVAERDDPDFERHMRRRTRGAVAAVGTTARDAAAMSVELGATAERLRRVLDRVERPADRAGY